MEIIFSDCIMASKRRFVLDDDSISNHKLMFSCKLLKTAKNNLIKINTESCLSSHQ